MHSWSLSLFLLGGGIWTRLGTTCSHLITEIFVHVVVALTFALREINKASSILIVAVSIVFASKFKGIYTCVIFGQECEIGEVVLGIRLELGLNCARPLFSSGDECVDIFVRIYSSLSTQNLIRSKAHHLHEFVLLQRGMLFRQTALLNDSGIQKEFAIGAFDNLFFDTTLRDEAKDLNWFLLTNSMRTILSLKINLGVPIRIIQYDNICCSKVDSKSSSTGAQKEDKLGGSIGVEFVHLGITLLTFGISINAAILMPHKATVILQDIQHASHL
mmetsp:Transcript_21889/g.36158  ORF Transcript_21889/g.36158 Transcript_21889/m.36158 type:complete len:274 (+) Transcript_21889:972-1793(+)